MLLKWLLQSELNDMSFSGHGDFFVGLLIFDISTKFHVAKWNKLWTMNYYIWKQGQINQTSSSLKDRWKSPKTNSSSQNWRHFAIFLSIGSWDYFEGLLNYTHAYQMLCCLDKLAIVAQSPPLPPPQTKTKKEKWNLRRHIDAPTKQNSPQYAYVCKTWRLYEIPENGLWRTAMHTNCWGFTWSAETQEKESHVIHGVCKARLH